MKKLKNKNSDPPKEPPWEAKEAISARKKGRRNAYEYSLQTCLHLHLA